ncbi:MAG: GPW/gp25 family protein [Novosphingobium sp.]
MSLTAQNLTGMSRTSGTALSGDDHLAQSIADIITTPLGSRVMRRDYGCLLFDLIDRPLGPATALLCSMAIAIALARWEPRIELKTVRIEGELAAGQASVTIEGIRTGSTANSLTRLSIPIARRT